MKTLTLRLLAVAAIIFIAARALAIDHPGITVPEIVPGNFTLIDDGMPVPVLYDTEDAKGIEVAVSNLSNDFKMVCGRRPLAAQLPSGRRLIVVGTPQSKYISRLQRQGKIDVSELKDKRETYLMSVVDNPFDGVDQALVIAGSDRRGVIYGIYELSEQLGVSPWYWWADVPVTPRRNLSMAPGRYTNGEPAVTYRGIFLNDEAPCLTSWVANQFGTPYGGHEFYAKVFELILRLRGNFLWPAMWSWAFYADDPLNSSLADEMGVIIGTSHHEPMARNHQEWARHRKEYGDWNYRTNRPTIDRFFADGIARMRGTEDVVTIGMRGDGDEAMSEEADVALLEKVIDNQRKTIKRVTGRPASETPQVWALYKEVLDYYDKGLRVPDDVILLLCDDNWGNVRRLPDERERRHPGGWGMYYHVDYVGAPRNSKWLNCTPPQGMAEQLALTHEYGVDKLWVLNVGDLKPMEYPITLFLDMAWNPDKYSPEHITDHTTAFCRSIFGDRYGDEAARIMNLYMKYNGRVTPEMLDADTYNIETGEWKRVRDDYMVLEAEALRLLAELPSETHDAYRQLVLFPVQAMANLYDMYYSQAENRRLYTMGDPESNVWADRAARAFARDSMLCAAYNNDIAGGKWRGMMTQKHIGYTSWNDDFPADRLPDLSRLDSCSGGWVALPSDGVVSIEAPHFFRANDASGASWRVMPDMGRTLGGVTLMPRLASTDGARLDFRMRPGHVPDSVDVYVTVKSTLAFSNLSGHRYTVGFEGTDAAEVNFNANLNEAKENIYTVFYPTVARRVVKSKVRVPISVGADGMATLSLCPLDPGIVFEKVEIDLGGYRPTYLGMPESPRVRH